ncbi:MAG: phosphinothricin acetyltransferase [Bacteroidetes bacterium]|nr:N-acetyltransferase [Sphingobacteriaceae bacterium AH-315-L07]PCH64715.1 MAG: phosphinothricin acetyltransferase [Bacteroidota bacterium]
MNRIVKPEDANALSKIYNYYILNSVVTFEETPLTVAEMKDRIQTNSSKFPWVVYEKDGQILGYAYAIEWKQRGAYKFSVESTVYLKQDEMNKGIGTALYAELIKRLTEMDIHAVIGGIALPNEASIALHEKLGFKKVAHFKEVGYKFEKWVDIGYWELMIN